MKKQTFVSIIEIVNFLNNQNKNLKYTIPELACAWADARAKFYQNTGNQVEKNIHFITGETEAEHLLSLKGCEIIEKYSTVDGHDMPVIYDGINQLFEGK